MDKGYLSPTQPQPLIQHHVYVLRDAVSYPTPSVPSFSIMSMYCETQSRTPHHQPLILHHVYVLRDTCTLPYHQPPHSASCLCIARRSLVPHTVSIAPVLSLPSPHRQHHPHAVSTAPVSPMLRLPSQPSSTTSLFDVFPIFPTLPKCSHPPHHPFGNPCELTLHLINRILSKHIVKLNEAESSRRLHLCIIVECTPEVYAPLCDSTAGLSCTS